jgi:hypothetical protein
MIQYPSDPLIAPYVAKPYFLYGWNNIFNFLKEVYPTVLLILFAAGCTFVVITEKDRKILGAALMSSFLVFMYFFPIYFSYRFLVYAHYFIVFFVVYTIFKSLKTKKFQVINMSSLFLLIAFIIAIGSNIYIHDLEEFEKSRVIKLQERFKVFEIGKYLKNNVEKDAIVIGYSRGLGWYQGISAYYGQLFTINLWENGEYREDLIKNIYLASSSKEAYYLIKKLVNDSKYTVSFSDPSGKEVERWYKKPAKIIILYDDVLARWLGKPESIHKFFDSRYFKVLYHIKNSKGEDFYVFEMK